MGAMNRMREMNDLSVAAKWRLAASYYLAGRDRIATKIISDLETKIPDYNEFSYSYGSNVRDEAMILETLTIMKDKDRAKDVMTDLANDLSSSRWYSTQSTAYGLLAIAKFVGAAGVDQEIKYELQVNNNKKANVKTSSAVSQKKIDVNSQLTGSVNVTNNCNKLLFIKVQLDGIPLIGDPTSANNDLNMTVTYKDLNGNIIDVSQLVQGTDFVAEVRVQHPGVRRNYKELALTQMFPSGWEIRNMRMEGESSVKSGSVPRYQDIRDDRVYSYFDIDRNHSKTFKIILNAAYVGKFYLPTVYCEAMYNNEINSQEGGYWVEVVKVD